MYNNFENPNNMHNKELVEGVNISNFLLYLSAIRTNIRNFRYHVNIFK